MILGSGCAMSSRDDSAAETDAPLTNGALAGGAAAAVVLLLTFGLDAAPADRLARGTAFWLLSLPPLLLAFPAWLDAARQRAAGGHVLRWGLGAGVAGAVALDRVVRGGANEALAALLYAAVALLLTADRPRRDGPLPRDVLVVLALWLPLELRWVRGDFVLLRLLGLDLLLLLYVVERPIFRLGRIVPASVRELAWAIGAWITFVAVAVPFALATDFARPGLAHRSAGEWALFILSTFWIIALPEEALFRGTIQELMTRALARPVVALLLASLVFGLSHLNNASNGHPAPDPRYVVLASIAGIAYGLAYLRTNSLAAPVLTHFLVDFTWRGLFAGPF